MQREKKERTLILIREVIVTQTNHWSLFALSYGLSVMLSAAYDIPRLNLLLWGVMGLGLIVNYFIRLKTRRMGTSILLHFLVFLLMSVTGLTCWEYLALHGGFAFFYCLLSLVKQYGGQEQEDEAFSIPVIAILICAPFFVLTLNQYENITGIYRNLLICLFTMFFMQHYFGRYGRFVKLNEHSAGFFPKSEIMGAGLKNVIIYVGVSAGLFFGIANMKALTEFGNFIKEKLGYWIKYLLRKIFGSNEEVEQIAAERLDYNDYDSLTAKLGQAEIKEESLFSIIIQKIIWFMIILLILYALYRFVKKILALFSMKLDTEGVIVDELVMDVRESCDKSSIKEKKTREKRFFLTPREKVRRFFRYSAKEKCYRICKSGDPAALGYKTSGECGNAVGVPELSALYDRARYSEEEITEQDVSEMKKIYERLTDS
ncbi:MAG: hypothetical protein IKO54_01620 [Lachnospiraceae bacterium]|nr:hypothetical protein [Lachnospiraceae bacterium]